MRNNGKLGFWGLTGLVFGSVIGGGIFNIAQNLARGASLLAVLIGWLVTAAGVLSLVLTFRILQRERPDLHGGLGRYAREGFGCYAGFNVAWGYMLSVAMANVAYVVMLANTLGAFFPSVSGRGWGSVLFCEGIVWLMYLIVRRGVRSAAMVNVVLSAIKFVSIVLICVILVLYCRAGLLTFEFRGAGGGGEESLLGQVESTMLVTLWCFIGIEGSVMMSSRARRAADVGRSAVTGFVLAWVLYVLVSVLCYGAMTRAELAGLPDPSVAYVLRHLAGDWAWVLVMLSVVVSLSGGLVSWTLLAAQTPVGAAEAGILPRQFMRDNKHGVPTFGLVVTSCVASVFVVMVSVAENVYLAALEITGVMVAPAYLFSALYLLKRELAGDSVRPARLLLGGVCSLFCLWTLFSAGIGVIAQSALLYLAGLPFYYVARRQTRRESGICAIRK